MKKCVGEDDELSHDGGDGDLFWLSGRDELVVFGFEVGIEAGRYQGWHIESLAYLRPATMNEGSSRPLAGLACLLRQSGKARGHALVEGAKLRHLDDEGRGGDLCDAGDRKKDRVPRRQIGLCGDARFDLVVDGRELTINLLQTLGVLALW